MFASFLDDTMTYSCAIFKVNISPNQWTFSFCTMCYQCTKIHSVQAEEYIAVFFNFVGARGVIDRCSDAQNQSHD